MKEDPQIPKGMAIPSDFLKILREGREKLWPTCHKCGAPLKIYLQPGDKCPVCDAIIPNPSTNNMSKD